MIFGRVGVLRDENRHRPGKREKGKEKKARSERQNTCFVTKKMRPSRLCDVNKCHSTFKALD